MAGPNLNIPGAQYPHIDVYDVQGVILRGYARFEHAEFVLLSIVDPPRARIWLREVHDCITTSAKTKGDHAANIAFTRGGFERLGLPKETVEMFSREFLEGMAHDTRSKLLGDLGHSEPGKWVWGKKNRAGDDDGDTIHAVLLLYAEEKDVLRVLRETLVERLGAGAIAPIQPSLPRAKRVTGHREHFGFRDGVSQPHIRNGNHERESHGVLRRSTDANTVNAGEFLLGYADEFGARPPSPIVEKDPNRYLVTGELGLPDFGHNGSYFVLRQLHQDVPGFWTSLAEQSAAVGIDKEVLAAKLVGRWPSGAPLVTNPNSDPGHVGTNDFAYRHEDPNGYRCPFGAHIRRANPRDSLDDAPGTLELARDPFQSPTRIANRHRLLRRGRTYGEPWTKKDDRLAPEKPGYERGLFFASFMASIRRQFEFVQRTWVNDLGFDGLRGEPDPFTSAKTGLAPFTIQAPVPSPRLNLPNFVQVRGGAYFFMPSLRALRYLASLQV